MAKEALTCDGKSFYWYDRVFFVELLIPYDTNVQNEKDLEIEFKDKHLRVNVKGQAPIVDGELYEDVEDKGFTWSLKNGNVHVVIKKSEAFSFWQHLFKKTDQKAEGH